MRKFMPALRAVSIASCHGLLAAAVCGVFTHAAQAGTLQSFSGVVGGAGTASIPNGCTTYGPPSDLAFFGGFAAGLQVLGGNAACGYSGGWTNLTSTGPGPLLNSASLSPTVLGNPGFAESFSGTASSRASFGSLGASAQGSYTGLPVSYTPGTTIADSVGAASFTDTLQASALPGYTKLSGNGFVRYEFSIDGSLKTPGVSTAFFNGEAVTDFRIQSNGGPIFDLMNAETYTGTKGFISGSQTLPGWTISTGLTSGGSVFESYLLGIDLSKPWDFEAGLIADAYGNAANDFSSTAKLVGVELFDANSKQIGNFTLTGTSGTCYAGCPTTTPISAPELNPSSLAAELTLFLGTGVLLRRRRRS